MNKRKISNILVAGLFLLPGFRNESGINFATPTATPIIIKPSIAPKILQKINLVKEEFKNRRGQLSNVTVVAVGTTDISVIDGDGKTIKVNVSTNTNFRRRFWGKSLISEISVNNKLDIVGRWANEGKTEINAVLIRNLSIQKRFGTFFGTVKTITDTGFVMTTIHRGEERIIIDPSTKLVNRKEVTITTSDINIGDRVRVKGLWDLTNFTITEVKQIKNFSLPPFATPSPEPTP